MNRATDSFEQVQQPKADFRERYVPDDPPKTQRSVCVKRRSTRRERDLEHALVGSWP